MTQAVRSTLPLARAPRSRVAVCVLAVVVLFVGQWCQAAMLVPAQTLNSVSVATEHATAHKCCPEKLPAQNVDDQCDSCPDELASESRSWDGSLDQPSTAGVDVALGHRIFFVDGVVGYWRYRETLWSWVVRPVFLRFSRFIE